MRAKRSPPPPAAPVRAPARDKMTKATMGAAAPAEAAKRKAPNPAQAMTNRTASTVFPRDFSECFAVSSIVLRKRVLASLTIICFSEFKRSFPMFHLATEVFGVHADLERSK